MTRQKAASSYCLQGGVYGEGADRENGLVPRGDPMKATVDDNFYQKNCQLQLDSETRTARQIPSIVTHPIESSELQCYDFLDTRPYPQDSVQQKDGSGMPKSVHNREQKQSHNNGSFRDSSDDVACSEEVSQSHADELRPEKDGKISVTCCEYGEKNGEVDMNRKSEAETVSVVNSSDVPSKAFDCGKNVQVLYAQTCLIIFFIFLHFR
jgi:hypothetical protein